MRLKKLCNYADCQDAKGHVATTSKIGDAINAEIIAVKYKLGLTSAPINRSAVSTKLMNIHDNSHGAADLAFAVKNSTIADLRKHIHIDGQIITTTLNELTSDFDYDFHLRPTVSMYDDELQRLIDAYDITEPSRCN